MNPEIAPVLAELAAVLKKHDMAGLLIVSNKTKTDYQFELQPSWSCARLEPLDDKTYGIRVRSKRAEYPSREAQKESLEQTVGMFITLSDMLPFITKQVHNLLFQIGKHYGEIESNTTFEK